MPTSLFDISTLPEINEQLREESPQAILRWAVDLFQPRIAMATAFGAEGCCLLHMLSEIEGSVFLFNLDTGYQFPETLALRERILERYGLAIELVRPDQTVAQYEASNGGPVYTHHPDRCCLERKIKPLRKALVGQEAWISAIRRDQTAQRGAAQVVQWDAKFGLVKINPLLSWSKQDVWSFVARHDVPYNPLHDQGFPSIGCWPCTQAVEHGADDRAGRWAGSAKKECGLHVLEHQDGSGI
jgi:phosphoadenosine phosphosulfate reductase